MFHPLRYRSSTSIIVTKTQIQVASDVNHAPAACSQPHEYDKELSIAHLFQKNMEDAQLYERLKKGIEGYLAKDIDESIDRSRLVDIVMDDLVRAYRAQPQYGQYATADKIIFRTHHLKNAAISIEQEFPGMGDRDVWYKQEGSISTGYLNVKRYTLKRQANIAKIRENIDDNINLASAKRSKRKKAPKDKAEGFKKPKNISHEPTIDDGLDNLSLECHGPPVNYTKILEEYSDHLIRQGLAKDERIQVDRIFQKFFFLKAYNGKMVS